MVKQAVALGILGMGEFKDGEMTSKGLAFKRGWVRERFRTKTPFTDCDSESLHHLEALKHADKHFIRLFRNA